MSNKLDKLKKEEKTKGWRAKKGKRYYCVTNYGVASDYCDIGDFVDNFNYKIRNYFKIEEEAKEYLENINTYFELMNLAEELNNGEEIDWQNHN